MNRSINAISITALSLVAACASAGTQPHDMSAAEHARAAGEHDAMGADHASQFRPAARDATDQSECARYLGSCWASNPTERHLDEAREHRAVAAKHRAAFEALRRAEVTACAGLSEVDRDVSPFVHREAIVRVEPLVRSDAPYSVDAHSEQIGATIVVRPAVGLTRERLQLVATCHVARAAALGHDAPELSFCPLAVKGVTASVGSTGDAFAINVAADSREAAAEVLARAKRLARP